MFWKDRTGLEKALIVVAALIVVLAMCERASAQSHDSSNDPKPSGVPAGPQFGVCDSSKALETWIANVERETVANAPRGALVDIARIQGRLAELCTTEPTNEQLADGSAAQWLLQADDVTVDLAFELVAILDKPLSTKARRYAHGIAFRVLWLDSTLGDKREKAYRAVRTETREVTKRVEVPAQCPRCPDLYCPEPPACPEGPSPVDIARQMRDAREEACNDALRSGVRSWYTDLERLARAAPGYDASGAVSRVATSVNECLSYYNNQVTCEGLGIRAESWLAQVRAAIRMDDGADRKASTIIRSQLNGIETDLSVRLRACSGGRH